LIERCALYSEIYLFADDAKLFKHKHAAPIGA